MTDINMRERTTAALVVVLLTAMLVFRLPALAEQLSQPSDDIHSMLEKSLSVIEIDKEVERIQEQRQQLLLSMTEAERQLAEQESGIQSKREQAGDVLRAYYTGERDQLYFSLFSSKSWTDFFRIWDYIDIIISHDKHTLNGYIQQYRDMQSHYAELNETQVLLNETEAKLNLQRERVLALEAELSEQLAGRSDSERILLLIQELTGFWQTAGLEEVREYFQALSNAMAGLPEWVQSNRELLEIKGFQYTIRVPEQKLNEFLREQDERFNYFSFRFHDDTITAHGKRDDIEISIAGHYTIQNEPVNGIIFHVDELLFNGFALPDTTRISLEEEFDLGFYPGYIFSFLKANSVEIKDGELIIKLSFTL